jgi:hypothetical protein
MPPVVHIIAAPEVFDINVVVVIPAYGPSLIKPKPIAAVLEAVIPADHLWMHHVERVVPAKIGAVAVVRNAAIMVAVIPIAVEAVVAIAMKAVIPIAVIPIVAITMESVVPIAVVPVVATVVSNGVSAL